MAESSAEEVVTVAELRALFNHSGFWEKALRGELVTSVLREGHPAPPKAPEPYNARSQIVDYFTLEGEKVAKVHQYLRPDGTLGASGKPDPKYVVINGVRYRAGKA
jgi:hypothetical protein